MEKPSPDDRQSDLADNLVEEESMREPIPPLTIPSSVSADTLRSHLPPELELVNVSKKFGSFVAVDNVSLKLLPGKNNIDDKILVSLCLVGLQHSIPG